MIDTLFAIVQLGAAVFLLWGAYICIACGERRRYNARTDHPQRRQSDVRRPSTVHLVDLVDEAANRATDFSIGFRRSPESLKRAA